MQPHFRNSDMICVLALLPATWQQILLIDKSLNLLMILEIKNVFE